MMLTRREGQLCHKRVFAEALTTKVKYTRLFGSCSIVVSVNSRNLARMKRPCQAVEGSVHSNELLLFYGSESDKAIGKSGHGSSNCVRVIRHLYTLYCQLSFYLVNVTGFSVTPYNVSMVQLSYFLLEGTATNDIY